MAQENNEHQCGCGCQQENGNQEPQCECGNQHGEGEAEHQCGCPHNENNQEHQCECGNQHGEGEEEHQCGCHHHHEEGEEQKIPDIDDIPDMELPAPDLLTLVQSLGTQAMVSLGLIPNPMTGKAIKRLNQAKHLIDTIQLVFDKTKGNRTEQETSIIESMIHELHMMYIRAK